MRAPLCSLPTSAAVYSHLGSSSRLPRRQWSPRAPQLPVPSPVVLAPPPPTSQVCGTVIPLAGVLRAIGLCLSCLRPLHLHELRLFVLRNWHLLVFHPLPSPFLGQLLQEAVLSPQPAPRSQWSLQSNCSFLSFHHLDSHFFSASPRALAGNTMLVYLPLCLQDLLQEVLPVYYRMNE